MRKKLISMFLSLCFVLTLLPVTAAAANATSVYVGGVELDSTTSYLVNGAAASSGTPGSNGCTAYFNAGTHTLTLNGANLVGTAGSMYRSAAIYAYGDLNIVLVGVNTATGADNAYGSSYGVYIELGALNISGSGSLAAAGGTAGNGNSYGIYAGTTITINAGTVTATGGTATNISSGISTYISVIVSGTASVTAVGGTGSQSHGVDCGATVSGGKLVAIGGKATGEQYGYGICDSTTYTGGLLVAKGQAGAARFEVMNSIGNTVVAPLSGAYNSKFAVWGPTDTYTVLDSMLDLGSNTTADTGWSDSGNSRGWKWQYAEGGTSTLTLKNIIINAPDTASDNSYGIKLPNGNVNIELEGVNIVSAGTSIEEYSSYGIYSESDGLKSLDISGGALISLGGSTNYSGVSYGIESGGTIYLRANTIIAIGGASKHSHSAGLVNTASTSDVNITGGSVIAVGGSEGRHERDGIGIYSYRSINITGGSGAAFAGSNASAKAFSSTPQGDATHVPALTAGAWSGKMAAWKTKTPQTITFNYPGAQNFGTTPTLTASTSSGLPVTFTSQTTGVATITSGGVLTFITAGTATITAHQAGNDTYAAATEVSQTFTVNAVVPGAPTGVTATAGDTQASVSFTPPANTGGSTITGYTVTVSPADVAPVNGASSPIVVTGLTNGQSYTFTVTADNVAGTGPASTASNSITPAATQTITFNNPGAQNFGTTPTLTATSDSGLTVTFTSSTPDVATITSNGVLTFISAGTATINANQPGNGTYLAAAQVSRTFTVNAVAPSAPTNVVATAGNGQVTVSFTPPAYTGDPNTSYTVTSIPGGITANGTGSPITVNGLTNGVSYTFRLTATNTAGTSVPTSESNSVTPQAPPTSDGGGSYTPPAPVTEIKNGSSTTGSNLDRLISGGKTLTVEADKGAKLVFDTDALKGIGSKTSGEIKVEMKDVSPSHQENLPGKQVFSLTVSSGSSTISDFGGSVSVSLPYELQEGETADKVTVWYLASDSTMTEIPCTYDSVTKLATFKVTHFSLYVVGVDAPWANPFADVKESDWFYGAVEFVNRNGLMQGVGGTDFGPNTTVTRGMLVTILWRLEDEPAATKTISFTDVADRKWYAKAVDWAAAENIVIGDAGSFNPEAALTREQMAAILYRYAAYKGYDVSAADDLSAYSDKPSDWALSSVKWAVAKGLIKGSGGSLNPMGGATRAESATILQRFIENTAK